VGRGGWVGLYISALQSLLREPFLFSTCIAIGLKFVAEPTVTLPTSVPVSLGFAATYDIIHVGE